MFHTIILTAVDNQINAKLKCKCSPNKLYWHGVPVEETLSVANHMM